MKKTTSVILIISMLLTVIFSIDISANGGTTTVGYLTFTEYDTYCVLTRCDTSASGSIEIPSSVNFNGKSLPVTSIGDWAFSGCSGLTSVTIPDSVTSIGSSAFRGCSSLKSVTIGNSVTSIGRFAFDGCSSLKSVTIPSSVMSIGDDAFYGCSGLTSVTIPDSVTSIGDSAFRGCSSLTSVTIPNRVTSIGSCAFCDCNNLKSITIPDSVTSIGNSAFSGCSSLTSVTIPNSVTSIGWEAFWGCSSLTSVTIPDSVTSIGRGVFDNCSSLTSIIVDENNTVYHSNGNCIIKTSDKTLIAGCNNSIIPDDGSVTSIGWEAFYGCSSLTSVTIGNSVTSIGSQAFYGCSSLTSVTIPNSVTSIGGDAFYGCSSLEKAIYFGSKNDWNKISIGSDNERLTNVIIYHTAHTYGDETVITAPTCTEKGTAQKVCTVCGYVHQYDLEKTDHTLTDWQSNGTEHWKECTECHAKFETSGHTLGEETIVTPATCTEKGTAQKVCTVCGHVHQYDLEKIDHTLTGWQSNGTEHWKECMECHAKFEKAGHTLGEETIITPATCTDKGEAKHTCTVCGYSYRYDLDAPGHDLTGWKNDGTDHWKECENCDEKFDTAEHTYGEETVITAPTCTQKGEAKKICTVCGYEHIYAIDALGHDFSKYGYDKDNHWLICIRCGETSDPEAHTDINVYCNVCGYSKLTKGDINGDGKVNNKDVITLFRYITAENAVYNYICDFNNDGKLNNKDVVMLFRYLNQG